MIKEDIMKKSKLFLLLACMIFATSGCQNNDVKQEGNDTPAVVENTQEADKPEEDVTPENNSTSQYDGLTLEQLEELGFEICGYSSFSSGSGYHISLSARKDYITLAFNIAEIDEEENEVISSERDTSDDKTDYMYNYIKENYADNTTSDCTITYDIYGHDTLLQAYEDGVYTKCENIENLTIEELYGEGYEYESNHGSSFGLGEDTQYDYLVSLKKDGGEFYVILDDTGNQALAELDFSASDEEKADSIKEATVIEAYQLNVN